MGSGTDRPNHDIVAHPDGVEDFELVVWESGVNVPQYGFDPLPPRWASMIGAVLGQDLYSRSDVPRFRASWCLRMIARFVSASVTIPSL